MSTTPPTDQQKIEAMVKALKDIAIRSKRIREDKAVVGIEASFIEQICKAALAQQGRT